MSECPGEGLCERFTGVAGDTDEEKFEEASPGCPQKCQSLRKAENSDADENDTPTINNLEILFNEHCAFPVSSEEIEKLEYFESECLIFWRKITTQFEREFQVTLRIFAEAHLKKK